MAPTPQRRWVRWPPSSPSGLSPGPSSTWRLHASSATTTRSRHEPCWPRLPAPWVSTWCMSHAPSSLPPLAPHSPGLSPAPCVHLVSQAPSPSPSPQPLLRSLCPEPSSPQCCLLLLPDPAPHSLPHIHPLPSQQHFPSALPLCPRPKSPKSPSCPEPPHGGCALSPTPVGSAGPLAPCPALSLLCSPQHGIHPAPGPRHPQPRRGGLRAAGGRGGLPARPCPPAWQHQRPCSLRPRGG